MAKKRNFHCERCGSECMIYRKGKKHRVLVCPKCGILATNPFSLKRGLSGALTGAAVGAPVAGIGAVPGAIGGALLGAFTGGDEGADSSAKSQNTSTPYVVMPPRRSHVDRVSQALAVKG